MHGLVKKHLDAIFCTSDFFSHDIGDDRHYGRFTEIYMIECLICSLKSSFFLVEFFD